MKITIKTLGYITAVAYIAVSLIFFAISLSGCSDPIDEPPPGKQNVTLSGIMLKTTSVKKVYDLNDELDLSGLVVTANYSDGTSKAVADYTASPAKGATLSKSGTTTVSISYTTETASFDIDVAKDPNKILTGIKAVYDEANHPVYTTTLLNDLKAHLTVTATYNNDPNDTAIVTDYELNGDITETGEKPIEVSYTEGEGGDEITVTYTFTVTVQLPPTKSISLSSVTFTNATYGYSSITAQTVTVTNTGTQATGALDVELSGTHMSSFTLSKTSINSIAFGGSDTFTVKPNDNLTVGTYEATITVSNDDIDTNNEINVSFTVNKAEVNLDVPTLSISGTTASWNNVANANTTDGYTIKIGTTEYTVDGSPYDLSSLGVGTHKISVKTNGYNNATHIYNASAYCAEQDFIVNKPQANLDMPTNLSISGTTASWDAVANAKTTDGYTIQIDTTEYTVASGTSYDLSSLGEGTYQISVKTNGYENPTHQYIESDYCAVETYTVNPPIVEYWSVTWELDGGEWAVGYTPVDEVERGTALSEPTPPTKEDHTFEGWYTDVGCLTSYTFTDTVDDDLTLYAKWEEE